MKRLYIIICILTVAVSVSAAPRKRQTMRIRQVVPETVDTTLQRYMVMLQKLTQEHQTQLQAPSLSTRPGGYSLHLVAPLTLYSTAIMQQFSSEKDSIGTDPKLTEQRIINDELVKVYISRPDLVQRTQSQLDEAGTLRTGLESTLTNDMRLTDKIVLSDLDTHLDDPTTLYTFKPNFWKFTGSGSLQFTQSYYTQNWYQGGESNYSGIGIVTLQANYDNKQHTQWENKLEFQLGFQTSSSDTHHSFKPTNNLVRLTSKLGRKAVSTLFYTAQLLTYSQLVPQYDNNSDNLRSEFLGPLYFNLSLGLDYKWNIKNFSGNVYVAPGSYDLRYVRNANLAARYGIADGGHCLNDGGSSITVNWNWTIWRNITYQSRAYFFSNYHYINFEWENTFNFTINKYMSAKLFLYPKYDDSSISYNTGNGYFMFNEWLSLGLNYNW